MPRTRTIMRATAMAIGLWLGLATTAMADGRFPTGLDPADQRRLQAFDDARAKAIAEARAKGSSEDVAELDRVLAGDPVPVVPAEIEGIWRCRTIKLGGMLPLVIYSDFRCRITDDSAGLGLTKLSGSQRTGGLFYDISETRLGYAGAGWIGGDERAYYGRDGADNQVGYLVRVGPDRMRLELPLPHLESDFDILELRR